MVISTEEYLITFCFVNGKSNTLPRALPGFLDFQQHFRAFFEVFAEGTCPCIPRV